MPEFKETVFYETTVKAILREEDLSLTLSVSAPYTPEKKRFVTVAVNEFSAEVKEAVLAALQAAQDEGLASGVQKAKEAALEAAKIARDKGEEV